MSPVVEGDDRCVDGIRERLAVEIVEDDLRFLLFVFLDDRCDCSRGFRFCSNLGGGFRDSASTFVVRQTVILLTQVEVRPTGATALPAAAQRPEQATLRCGAPCEKEQFRVFQARAADSVLPGRDPGDRLGFEARGPRP